MSRLMKPQVKKFLERYGLQHPIVQAPMAGASTVELAATVTKLGGLGSLPLGSFSESPENIVTQMRSFQNMTGGSRNVNLNFFCHEQTIRDQEKDTKWLAKYKLFYDQLEVNKEPTEMDLLYPSFASISDPSHATVRTLIELNPKIVSFHFGVPNVSVIKALQGSGISVFICCTNVEEFKQCQDAGADAVVLQGWEAGGHRGNFIANDPCDSKLSTQELVSSIISYVDENQVDPPFLIAAGGIYSSSLIKKLLDLGVAAVQLGTVWLPTTQCTISPEHLSLFQSTSEKTFMSPAISGRNLRTIETPFLSELSQCRVEEIPYYPLPYDAFKKFSAAIGKPLAFLSGSEFSKSWKSTRDVSAVFNDLIKEL